MAIPTAEKNTCRLRSLTRDYYFAAARDQMSAVELTHMLPNCCTDREQLLIRGRA